jgi:hypothetical protein
MDQNRGGGESGVAKPVLAVVVEPDGVVIRAVLRGVEDLDAARATARVAGGVLEVRLPRLPAGSTTPAGSAEREDEPRRRWRTGAPIPPHKP